ncbi:MULTISPECIES: class I SAM-dependent methyltransferase [Mycobacteroides]|uniref:Methyltransferase type 12 n=1 Tax=Mycobacteroides chelonae TaxID=1774 RepID=A0A1S1LTG9_MYCCH|nr:MULTISPECIES: class I SAM-dependent methyltransferase [Mycobacteroides]KRQ22280.1 methyltransferase type 12 [Mycobacteroides sp. H003]KRQ27711.1 methyltransferase type 12 [Mycobacteroides sp. H092]KRQ40727.1 methyltransferase type 12 [Mycobacteroides sp. H101]KRQ42423.1 methyltransferase type 12 [Mycobacteroides sp. H063]KRQ54658.1 methyltransferase type 12 [Mycobacteroides sp. HXVII]
MTEQSQPAHTDRRRAESFGGSADAYDRHRPRYPQPLIDELVSGGHTRALDVGAGTGIAAAQLAAAGAEVLAVEPDARMAQIAAAKSIDVEVATFEDWQPAGRTFDLVLFAQSFHWVEPTAALRKVLTVLRPGGRLALVWNRIVPTSPTQQDLDTVYADFMDTTKRPSINTEDTVSATIEKSGYHVRHSHFLDRPHFSTQAYLDMVFTYSNHLTLDAAARSVLRSRLEETIGDRGVDTTNDALALICTPVA